jgi:hypothetical protein
LTNHIHVIYAKQYSTVIDGNNKILGSNTRVVFSVIPHSLRKNKKTLNKGCVGM